MKTALRSVSENGQQMERACEKTAPATQTSKSRKGLLSPALSSRGGEEENISQRRTPDIVTPLLSVKELSSVAERQKWTRRYREIRAFSEELAKPLQAEDCVIQSMPDASPAKWHLAHTSWFFETFILRPGLANYH